VATAAIAVAGAVEVKRYVGGDQPERQALAERSAPERTPTREAPILASTDVAPADEAKDEHATPPAPAPAPVEEPPAEPASPESAPASSPPAEEPAPPAEETPHGEHESGVVTVIGTHEGPMTTEPAPSEEESSDSSTSSPPPSNSSPPPEEESAQSGPVVEVVPAGS
jgi:hypothetical protein